LRASKLLPILPAVTRANIQLLERQLEAAYRTDPFHALRKNIESVLPGEWHTAPGEHSAAVFGDQPELSICDVVVHVGGAMRMYADRAFGTGTLQWGGITVPASFEMGPVLTWLDEGHALVADGLRALADDAELLVERPAPWGMPLARGLMVGLMINHALYHSGEVNRQRALIRGATGWEGPATGQA
jgi:hypothetical protein